jgi:hypothetical protein
MKDYYTINSKNNINKIDIEIEARRIYKDSLSDTKYSSVKDLSVMQTLIEDFKSRNELKSQLFKRIIENAIGFARINNLYMIHIKFILLSLIFDILNANSPLQAEISPLDEILFTR